jgi:diguanylate cyclase (GGDEF)-like protein
MTSQVQAGFAAEFAPGSDARLVDAVTDLQILVSNGASAETMYQAAVDGAMRLLDADCGSLRFVDPQDASWMVAVATHRKAGHGERWRQRSPVTEGVSGQVILTGELVAAEDYQRAPSGSSLAPADMHAVIAVPVRDRGQVVGSLLVGSTVKGRRWLLRDQVLMSAFAKHVGVALAVVKAGQAVTQALTDGLTGLHNRAMLLDRLEHELVVADRGGARDVTVLFLDLDGFKLVNDSLGHDVGDQLLVAVAQRLLHCTRQVDTCARIGGDEFAVLLTGKADPVAVTERIIAALQRGFQIGEHEVFVSVSVGIASGRDQAEKLLSNADVAMYQAKRAGPGLYRHFEPSMQVARVSRFELKTDLQRALERGEFKLCYQPVFDLRSHKIASFEALLRWHHPLRGPVSPLEFIPVAEETGLIVEIGRWVLAEACSWFAASSGGTSHAISVNVSMRELRQPDYATAVQEAIGGAFPPSALILEVTEGAPLRDAPGALASLRAVKELGVRVALDDFGTGYSSLLSLAELPVDLLKVAGPFLEATAADSGKPAGLLAGILGLGGHLGLMTIAKGIERPEQRQLLIDLGCEFGQGNLLGPPLDAAGARELLSAAPRATRAGRARID